VLKKICAGAWLNWSVCIERTTAMWSITFARCGSAADRLAPQAPWRAKPKRGPSRVASLRMKA
jgi:hypothetical protein